MIRFKRKEYLPLLFLTVITLLIFWQFFLTGLHPFPGNFLIAWFEPWRTDTISNGVITIANKPIADDVFRLYIPFKTLAMDQFKKAELPLWNPYNGTGMPLMAMIHVGFLSPFNLLYFFLPLPLSHTVYIIIQTSLIPIFTYLYTRKIGLSTKAGIFSATAFLFSGFVITRSIFAEFNFVVAGLPFLLFLIDTYFQNKNTKLIFLLPFAIFIIFTSGHPQIITYVLSLCILYTVFKVFQEKNSFYKTRVFISLLLLFLLGIGLSAIQLIPTIELFFSASINTVTSKFIFSQFLLPISHFVNILIPNYYGNESTYNYWGTGGYAETVASIGIIPCFFAFWAIQNRKNKYKSFTVFFSAVTILSILLSMDWIGSRLFYNLPIPIISTGIPSRILLLSTFAISILSGIGYEILSSQKIIKKDFSKMIPFFILLTIISGITFYLFEKEISCNNPQVLSCRTIALRNTILELGIFSILLTFLLIYILKKSRIIKNIFTFISIILIICIGLYNSNKYLSFSSSRTFLPENKLLNTFASITDDWRIFTAGEGKIKNNFATYFKYYDPDFYDPLYIRRYGELINFANNGNSKFKLARSDVDIVNDLNIKPKAEFRRDRLLDLLSVKYITVNRNDYFKINTDNADWKNKNWSILKRNNTLPRSNLVHNFEIIKNDTAILERLFDPSFDYKNTILLEDDPQLSYVPGTSSGRIHTKKYMENQVYLQLESPINNILLLTDNYYPGWKAYIDGSETKLYRANYSFRAIEIPKGKHNILFQYQPSSFQIGLIISMLSFIIYVCLYFKVYGTRNNNEK